MSKKHLLNSFLNKFIFNHKTNISFPALNPTVLNGIWIIYHISLNYIKTIFSKHTSHYSTANKYK